MFAIVETGGKQYRVAKDNTIEVEKLEGAAGDKVTLENVLLVSKGEGDVVVGTPVVEGAKVVAEIVDNFRTDKVVVFKKKRRHNYRRTHGHRQSMMTLKIVDIVA